MYLLKLLGGWAILTFLLIVALPAVEKPSLKLTEVQTLKVQVQQLKEEQFKAKTDKAFQEQFKVEADELNKAHTELYQSLLREHGITEPAKYTLKANPDKSLEFVLNAPEPAKETAPKVKK